MPIDDDAIEPAVKAFFHEMDVMGGSGGAAMRKAFAAYEAAKEPVSLERSFQVFHDTVINGGDFRSGLKAVLTEAGVSHAD